jgi:hypothetical protein
MNKKSEIIAFSLWSFVCLTVFELKKQPVIKFVD